MRKKEKLEKKMSSSFLPPPWTYIKKKEKGLANNTLFTYIVFFFSSYKCLYCVMNTDDFYL